MRLFICLCCEYLQCVSLFVSVASICSVSVVKLMKLFSSFAGVFFLFVVRFFICLSCEYLQNLLSN